MDTIEDRQLAELRPLAFGIAYRMLGSVAEAEDVAQESLLRLHDAREEVASPRAFLTTVATRLAIDQLRSARVRREHYAGEWLPEPLVADTSADPAEQAELADSLSLAFVALLERLSPDQRAVLLLRDVFHYGYGEIAAIIGKTEANARQLAVRARRHVEADRPRFEASRERREELAQRFFAAAEDGDLEGARSAAGAATSRSTATAAARCPRWPGRCTAARGWRARSWRGRARGGGSAGSRCAGST